MFACFLVTVWVLYGFLLLDEIRIRMPKGQKDVIKAHAEARGESVNAFVGRAIEETMQRDKAAPGASEDK